MTPLNHLELFDEKFGVLMLGDTIGADEVHQKILKQHLIQTVISVLEDQITLIEKSIANAQMFVPFLRVHHIEGLEQARLTIQVTLSEWKALL